MGVLVLVVCSGSHLSQRLVTYGERGSNKHKQTSHTLHHTLGTKAEHHGNTLSVNKTHTQICHG